MSSSCRSYTDRASAACLPPTLTDTAAGASGTHRFLFAMFDLNAHLLCHVLVLPGQLRHLPQFLTHAMTLLQQYLHPAQVPQVSYRQWTCGDRTHVILSLKALSCSSFPLELLLQPRHYGKQFFTTLLSSSGCCSTARQTVTRLQSSITRRRRAMCAVLPTSTIVATTAPH